MSRFYRFELVGGPFDGSKGMAWVDDGEHPLPDCIFVGRCNAGTCGHERCPGRGHVWYWLEADAVPDHVVKYLKSDTEQLLGPAHDGSDLWLARFVHCEVNPIREGEQVEERELVTAGVGRVEEVRDDGTIKVRLGQ